MATLPIPVFAQEVATANNVQVVDGQGNPLEDVSAFWFNDGKAKKLSPDGSRFKGVADEGLIVATKEGYQYSGVILNKDVNELKLLRKNETGPVRKTLPNPLTKKVREKVLADIIRSLSENLESNPKDQRALALQLPLLARLAPDKAQKFLDEHKLPPMMLPMVQKGMIQCLAKTDFEAAAEIIDTVDQPEFRSMLLSVMLDSLPPTSPKLGAIESQFMDAIQTIKQPGFKFASLAAMAEHFEATNRPEKTKQICDTFLPEVEKLPSGGWSAYPRSLFAAMIVADQPDKAAELIKGTDVAHELTRALGRLAFHCCESDPARAIQFLSEMKHDENTINKYGKHYRVAYRMAAKHPEAAMELAKSVSEPNQRAWTYGQIARQLNSTNPKLAREAFQRALDSIETIAPGGSAKPEAATSYFTPGETLAGLLPVAEIVCPEKVDSLVWQSVWLAIPRTRWSKAKGISNPLQNTATSIARYNRELGLSLSGDKIVVTSRGVEALVTQMVFHPLKHEELFSEENLANRQFLPSRAYEKAVELLQANDQEFWQAISVPEFMQWPNDKYEDH